ncbi:tyrosine-protein phosphatase non-receptor type 11-like isoform X3 [Equus przewalskii]|uniref:Tyrosine-protein phosphatase non-receptor type 11-like isoform X3 n=1 Tax=Equus przewalskii TaxID=9798 RepID=A0ABM4N9T2_EQUPR|nr:tyrosine-protein phosphatase non-receptor type 6 isoform X3 [Equus caballus]
MTSRRWFHPNIGGVEAEQLLLSQGQHGSFLARPSRSCPGGFTLSVRRHDEVTHIKIQNTGDYYDLYGGEKFATLAELVQHYMDQRGGLLRERSGAPVELRHPLGCQDPTTERWYHGHLSGKEAEKLLMEKGRPGSFLVRESQSKPGDFVLSVLTQQPDKADRRPRVTHVMIHFQTGSSTWGVGSSSTLLETWSSATGRTPWWRSRGPWCISSSPSRPRGSMPQASRTACRSSVRLQKPPRRPSRASGRSLRCCSSRNAGSCFPGRRDSGQRTSPRIATRTSSPLTPPVLPCMTWTAASLELTTSTPTTSGKQLILTHFQSDPEEKPGHGLGKVYIATQGCLQTTVAAFWAMVHQENTRVIVMTTREVERGRNKCFRYWPQLHDSQEYGRVCVCSMAEYQAQGYCVRELQVWRPDQEEPPRAVKHYQYFSWPDHGVPAEPAGVLGFLDEVNRAQSSMPGAGPMVVHCSAGIGRTGTIIVIDILVDVIRRQGLDCDIDVPTTIQLVRRQRSGMVQTEAQYKFVYLALQRYIQGEQLRLREQRARPEEPDYLNVGSAPADPHSSPAPAPIRAPATTPEPSGGVYENLPGLGR